MSRRPLMSQFAFLMTLAATVVLAACGAPKTSDRDIVYVDSDEAIALTQGRAPLLGLGRPVSTAYVDARTEAEYRQARLPGAIHMPIESARQDHRSLREYGVLIVYGNDYNSVRADALSKTLIELGHDVRTLRGGLRAWQGAGHPIEGESR